MREGPVRGVTARLHTRAHGRFPPEPRTVPRLSLFLRSSPRDARRCPRCPHTLLARHPPPRAGRRLQQPLAVEGGAGRGRALAPGGAALAALVPPPQPPQGPRPHAVRAVRPRHPRRARARRHRPRDVARPRDVPRRALRPQRPHRPRLRRARQPVLVHGPAARGHAPPRPRRPPALPPRPPLARPLPPPKTA